MKKESIEALEVDLLLEAIFRKYDYDLHGFNRDTLERRLNHFLQASGLKSVSHVIYKILRDKVCFSELLSKLSINVTELFRDASFYQALRDQIIPKLRDHSIIKIWHAGCSTGEEVYSLAILLYEEGLLDKCVIYGTDFNHENIEKAKNGIFPLHLMQKYSDNYRKSGGRNSFATYFKTNYDNAIISPNIKSKIIFSYHNLISDNPFGEMNLLLCRNVLIYFNESVRESVIKLFYNSLEKKRYILSWSKRIFISF